MEQFLDNWYLIVGAVAVLIVAILKVVEFFKRPSSEQIADLKQWLIFICGEAERLLGSGTGKLKLRYVYDKFLERFPYLAKFISFETFSGYVDEALEQLKALLESNSKVSAYINSEN